ncbi:hypothetical protein, partial [Paenibacillus dendrobii]|uniref:hypothetical protein n=1 Tax=Paenibacillus dendrobii TaxID=2691084 RepID=UPI001F2C9D20
AASVRPEPGSNSPRKFVAHFETDEIKNLICAPQFGDRTALRFDFIAEVCISLVVQFSKIKFFRFRSRSVSSAATLIIYHAAHHFVKHFFLNSFFLPGSSA